MIYMINSFKFQGPDDVSFSLNTIPLNIKPKSKTLEKTILPIQIVQDKLRQ